MCTSSKPRNSYKDLGFEAKTLNSKFSIRSAHSRLHKDRPTNTMLGFQRTYTLESKIPRLSKLLKSIHTQSPISVDQAHCFFSWELRRSQKLRPIELRENRVSKGKEKYIPVLEVARLLLPSSAAKHIRGSQFATFSFPRLPSISPNREKIQ